MEFLVLIIGALVFIVIFGLAKAGVGAGEESQLSKSLGFDVRIRKEKARSDGATGEFLAIEAKGRLPVKRPVVLGCLITIFDVTDGREYRMPIISLLEFFQEEDSKIFSFYQNVGAVSPGDELVDWAPAGAIIPEMIQAPYSGRRKLQVNIFFLDVNNQPEVEFGVLDSREGVEWSGTLTHEVFLPVKGYKESAANRDEAQALTVKLGVAVAMADGSLHDSERELIKKWLQKTVRGYYPEKSQELKKTYNDAFREAYILANRDRLDYESIARRLNEIGEIKLKFDAYELVNKIMAADGVAHPEELKTIRRIGELLDLNPSELEQIRSRALVNLKDAFQSEDSFEKSLELLEIDASWTTSKIKTHLSQQFQKWNGRLNSLSEGEARENAQNILNRIGDVRSILDLIGETIKKHNIRENSLEKLLERLGIDSSWTISRIKAYMVEKFKK